AQGVKGGGAEGVVLFVADDVAGVVELELGRAEVVVELEAPACDADAAAPDIDVFGLGHGDAASAVWDVQGLALDLECRSLVAPVHLEAAEINVLFEDSGVEPDLAHALAGSVVREEHLAPAAEAGLLQAVSVVPQH